MAARGVVAPHARQDLIAAAAWLVERKGARSISVRAITARAGVATGSLYQHFNGLDDLLVALVVDRFEVVASEGRALHEQAGLGTVVHNLIEFGRRMAAGPSVPLATLMARRPDLAARARDALGAAQAPGQEQLERAVADYLCAEQHLARIRRDVDAGGAALMLVSGWHRLIFDDPSDPSAVAAQAEQLVRTLMIGLGSPEAHVTLAPAASR